MDILKAIKNVRNVNDYITLTNDVANKDESFQIPFNMTSVLGLKKICSYEVEYFNKCQEVGAAFMIFERMLKLPPSKTWPLLGKELVSLLFYWIEALRKHLISHCSNWWTFLKSLLKFIHELRLKDLTICNILVEQTSECLLYLATSDRLDLTQRFDVIRCLNQCCITSDREIRLALGKKFNGYFVKLSQFMASCGHFPTQLSIMELLLRWLLGRHDRSARAVAAVDWFPNTQYSEEAVGLFLERSFKDFYKDARDFLNVYNKCNDNVTSVICRKLLIGNVSIISEKDNVQSWLDINSAQACLTVLIDPRILRDLGLNNVTCHEVLTVSCDNTHSAQLYRESVQVIVSIKTANEPEFMCESTISILDEDKRNIKICISGRSDLQRVDNALKRALGDNYECTMADERTIVGPSLSPPDSVETDKKFIGSEDETRFSNSYQVPMPKVKLSQKRRKRSGYITKTRKLSGWKSPSSTSTSSLAQLHDKLAALPKIVYDKEPVSILALPDLSSVIELSEPDESSSNTTASTFKLGRAYGFAHKSRPKIYRKSKTSPSDNEELITKKCIVSDETNAEEKSTSCLFVATIGSTDESVINDTFEKTKNKDTDLVNLFFRDALDNNNKELLDSGINTGENGKRTQDLEHNSEAIENTPTILKSEIKNQIFNSHKKENVIPCTVLSKTTSEESNADNNKQNVKLNPTTSDESNTDGIVETPRNYVNVRRKNLRSRKDFSQPAKVSCDDQINNRRSSYNIEDIEDFFSQHFKENKEGELIISPTLARKINLSSSETSESFDKYLISNNNQLNEFDVDPNIIDCLNSMVEKVCNEFEKCTEYFNQGNTRLNKDLLKQNVDMNEPKRIDCIENAPDTVTASLESAVIKLNYKKTIVPKKEKVTEKKKTLKSKKKINVELPKKLPIQEESIEKDVTIIDMSVNSKTSTKEKPLPKQTRRKRKLYSPKDDDVGKEIDDEIIPLTDYIKRIQQTTPEQKIKLQTPKSTAACYLEIEEERKKFVRQSRNRKSKASPPQLSPKTVNKNKIFDTLKDKIENNNDVMLVDKKSSELDIAIYNFTSDSEDEDFKQKKINIKNRRSASTVRSNESATTRIGRSVNRINYSESKTNSSAEEGVKLKREATRRRVTNRQTTKARGRKPKADVNKNLEDERMRNTTPMEIVSSPVTKESKKKIETPVEPKLNVQPALEIISEGSFEENCNQNIPEIKTAKRDKKKTAFLLSIKKEKGIKANEGNIKEIDNEKESPLPALIIETVSKKVQDDNVSTASSNLIKKCNKLYQFGEEDITDTTQNLLSDLENVNYSPVPLENEFVDNPEDNNDNITAKQIETIDLVEIPQKNKSQFKSKLNKPEKNSCIDSVTSDKSIDTIGKSPITAHGDDNESPPGPELLKQNIVPRNFDLEGMSSSMKNYFLLLSTQAHEKPKKMQQLKDTKKLKRSYDTENSLLSVNKESIKNLKDLSPVVSIEKLNDDYFRKWLPSPRSSVSEDFQSKIKKSIENSPVSSVRIATKSNSQEHSNHIEEERLSNTKIGKKTSSTNYKEHNQFNLSAINKEDIVFTSQKRKSVISPINIVLDEIEDDMDISESKTNETLHDIKELRSQNPTKITPDIVTMNKYYLRSMSDEKQSSKETDDIQESPPKKRKVEMYQKADAVSVPASVQSVESVREWFTRGTRMESSGDIHFACKESVENVMEKLDTTLLEIQQNTSKKFSHMFVDMQKVQAELEAKRSELFKETARDMMKGFMQIVETKFVELTDKCDKLNTEYQQDLKRRAVEVMREDTKQKRAMVAILYEDVEAVLRHLNTRRSN